MVLEARNAATGALNSFAGDLGRVAAGVFSVQQVITAFNRGGELQGVSAAFDKLGGDMERLQEATGGTIASLEAMRIANKALNADISFETFVRTMEGVRTITTATGQDFEGTLDRIVTGLSRGSTQILDDIGIIIDATGKAKSEIIDEFLVQLDEKVARLGGTMETAKTRTQEYSAAIADLRDQIGLLLAESPLPEWLGVVADALSDATVGLREWNRLFKDETFWARVQIFGNVLAMMGLDPTSPIGAQGAAQQWIENRLGGKRADGSSMGGFKQMEGRDAAAAKNAERASYGPPASRAGQFSGTIGMLATQVQGRSDAEARAIATRLFANFGLLSADEQSQIARTIGDRSVGIADLFGPTGSSGGGGGRGQAPIAQQDTFTPTARALARLVNMVRGVVGANQRDLQGTLNRLGAVEFERQPLTFTTSASYDRYVMLEQLGSLPLIPPPPVPQERLDLIEAYRARGLTIGDRTTAEARRKLNAKERSDQLQDQLRSSAESLTLAAVTGDREGIAAAVGSTASAGIASIKALGDAAGPLGSVVGGLISSVLGKALARREKTPLEIQDVRVREFAPDLELRLANLVTAAQLGATNLGATRGLRAAASLGM